MGLFNSILALSQNSIGILAQSKMIVNDYLNFIWWWF
jgi:hypothetical protein